MGINKAGIGVVAAARVQGGGHAGVSGGIVGGPYRYHGNGGNGVELIFCNPDLLWRSDYPWSRYGQGVFKEAFQAVFRVSGLEFLNAIGPR